MTDKRRLAEHMKVYAVTDRSFLAEGETLIKQVEKALLGGAGMIQLREKNMDEEAFLAEAREIKELTMRYGAPLIINDNVDVALKCGADGVHVGQNDMEAQRARALLGGDRIIGVSVHNVEEALAAEENGADYLGAGAVFTTSTKGDAKGLSHEILKNICDAVRIPVVAIGGITEENLMLLSGSGISGVAVVSAIFAAEDIETATGRLVAAVEKKIFHEV